MEHTLIGWVYEDGRFNRPSGQTKNLTLDAILLWDVPFSVPYLILEKEGRFIVLKQVYIGPEQRRHIEELGVYDDEHTAIMAARLNLPSQTV